MSDEAAHDAWHLIGEGSNGETDYDSTPSNNEAKACGGERRSLFTMSYEPLQMLMRATPPSPSTPQQFMSRLPRFASSANPKEGAVGAVHEGTGVAAPAAAEMTPLAGVALKMPSRGPESFPQVSVEAAASGEEAKACVPAMQLLGAGEGLPGMEDLPSLVDEDSDVEAEVDLGTEEQDWRDTAQLERDIRQACLGAPRARLQSTTRFCKVLLVGEKGLGKSTLLRNLAAGFSPESMEGGAAEGVSGTAFLDQPHLMCTDICVPDPLGGNNFHYLLQDTPGLNSGEDVEVVLDYVRAQLHAYVAAEEDSKRSQPMSRLPDPRVDVALYFIAPHSLKPQDIEAMTRLSELVPVVPLLAKADAMTAVELADFRELVRERLQAASAAAGRPVMYDFSAAAVASAGALRSIPPFAVVGAAKADLSVGPSWPVRVYPWGKVEALSSSHSDLLALRKLLFESAFEELKSGTEARYYAFRRAHLAAHRWLPLPPWLTRLNPWAAAGEVGSKLPAMAVPPRPLTERRRGGRAEQPACRARTSLTRLKWGLLVLGACIVLTNNWRTYRVSFAPCRMHSNATSSRELLDWAELVGELKGQLRKLELGPGNVPLWR